MAEQSINISELERIAASSSRYLVKLEEAWGRPVQYQQHLAQVQEYLKEQGMAPASLELLAKHSGSGVIYIELPLGAREFHGQAAQLLLDCCRQEVLGQPDVKLWEKWREFGQNIYYGTIGELYDNFTAADPQLSLLFEIAYRKLMAESSAVWWEAQPERARRHRAAINRRFGLELNGILRPVRQRMAEKLKFDLKPMEKFVDLGWEMEFDPAKPQAREFAVALRELGLTEWLMRELFQLLYIDQIKSQEELIWETLRSSTFAKPDEIISTLSGRLPKVSEQALREIQKILARRASELEAKVSQELAELQKFSVRVKKQTQDLIGQNNTEMARVVETKLYSENLVNLSAKITDSLMQFQRSLSGQLWYLQDLERKERSLQSVVEKCQYLAKMPPAELQSLLTSKSGEFGCDILEHILQYKILNKQLGQGWEAWTSARGKALADLLRSAIDQCQGQAKAPEQPAGRSGAKGAKAADKAAEREQAELDLKAMASLIEEKGGGRIYHVEKLVAGYRKFVYDVAELQINYRRLCDLVRLWPPLLIKNPPLLRQHELFDEVRYMSDRVRREGQYYLFAAQGPVVPKPKESGEQAQAFRERLSRRYAKSASVMVYDIRGSSFMSAKLRNSEKEREIKNKLGYLVAQVIKQHGGFIIKDTGDGGVAWFGDNAAELYEKCFKEVTTGRGMKLRHSISSGADVTMLPSTEASLLALTSAAQMLKAAEKFIQDNFSNYRDWFKEATEREIFYEGMNYAVLPPEFKALFRIGVGVASGEPGREITLNLNSYGDVDVCGTLVNDASLYASGRDPSHSIIMTDHATCFNLLMNVERFSSAYLGQYWAGRADCPDAWEAKLREAVGLAEAVLPDGSYCFPGVNLTIKRAGYLVASRSEVAKECNLKLEPEDQGLALLDDCRLLKADDRSEVKVVYEVQPTEGEEK